MLLLTYHKIKAGNIIPLLPSYFRQGFIRNLIACIFLSMLSACQTPPALDFPDGDRNKRVPVNTSFERLSLNGDSSRGMQWHLR